jgi:hypothetical protein
MSTPQSTGKFLRRIDASGVHVSFCVVCFQTVARSLSRAELAKGEKQHDCSGPPLLPQKHHLK